jgi:hypothetical protein
MLSRVFAGIRIPGSAPFTPASQPSVAFVKCPPLIGLCVGAELPNVPAPVLREVVKCPLGELSAIEVLIQDHGGAHPVDPLTRSVIV